MNNALENSILNKFSSVGNFEDMLLYKDTIRQYSDIPKGFMDLILNHNNHIMINLMNFSNSCSNEEKDTDLFKFCFLETLFNLYDINYPLIEKSQATIKVDNTKNHVIEMQPALQLTRTFYSLGTIVPHLLTPLNQNQTYSPSFFICKVIESVENVSMKKELIEKAHIFQQKIKTTFTSFEVPQKLATNSFIFPSHLIKHTPVSFYSYTKALFDLITNTKQNSTLPDIDKNQIISLAQKYLDETMEDLFKSFKHKVAVRSKEIGETEYQLFFKEFFNTYHFNPSRFIKDDREFFNCINEYTYKQCSAAFCFTEETVSKMFKCVDESLYIDFNIFALFHTQYEPVNSSTIFFLKKIFVEDLFKIFQELQKSSPSFVIHFLVQNPNSEKFSFYNHNQIPNHKIRIKFTKTSKDSNLNLHDLALKFHDAFLSIFLDTIAQEPNYCERVNVMAIKEYCASHLPSIVRNILLNAFLESSSPTLVKAHKKLKI